MRQISDDELRLKISELLETYIRVGNDILDSDDDSEKHFERLARRSMRERCEHFFRQAENILEQE